MSKVPISVCIIAKNEEKHIEECLKRLLPYGFEIIVTDTGSSDRTKQLAQKYADKVLDYEWKDDFSAARNFCISHASNNWILSLDCDEYVTNIDMAALRILMQKFPKDTGAIRLKNLIYNHNNNDNMEYGSDDVTRFFNKNYYMFTEPIHEQVSYKEEAKRTEVMKTFLLPMEVIHHGYALSKEEMQEKQKRNLNLLYASLEKSKEEQPYIYFQIAQSEFIMENYEKSAQMYEKVLALTEDIQYEYIQITIMSLAKAYVRLERIQDAVALMEKYAPSCCTAKYTFTHAGVLLDSGNIMKALMLYVKTTTMPDVDTLGENLLHCYEHIIELQTKLGNYEVAELFRAKYESCLKEKERVISNI